MRLTLLVAVCLGYCLGFPAGAGRVDDIGPDDTPVGAVADVLDATDRAQARAWAHYMVARERLISGGPDAATVASDHLAAALRDAPGDAWLVQEYQQIWSLQPELLARRARADLEHTAWRHPEATALVRLVAQSCLAQGDGERAERLFRRAGSACDWADTGLVCELATLHWRAGRTYDAHQVLERANRPDRCAGDWRYRSFAGLYYSVVLARDAGRPQRWYYERFDRLRREHLLAAAAILPASGDDSLALRLAQGLVLAGEPTAAAAALARHQSEGHWTSSTMRFLARAREAAGDRDGALAALDLLIAAEPTEDVYLLARAQVLSRAEDPAAIAAYGEAYEVRRRAGTLAAWAAELIRHGDPQKARLLARALHPADPRRYSLDAQACLDADRADLALTTLADGEAALIDAGHPERLDADYYLLMSRAAATAGHTGAAGHALAIGLSRHPDDPELLLARALWLADHGYAPKDGTRLARRALELAADDASAARSEAVRAWTYHRRGCHWRARCHMRRARRLAAPAGLGSDLAPLAATVLGEE